MNTVRVLVHIAAHAGNDVAFPFFRKEAERKAEQLLIELNPDIADNTGTNGNHGSGREEITSCLQEGHARHEQSQQQQGGAGTVLIDELGDVILEVVDDDVLDGSIRTPRHKSISGFLHLKQDAQYGHDE